MPANSSNDALAWSPPLDSVEGVIPRQYTPSPLEDLALLAWWGELVTSGDLATAFDSTAISLTSFLGRFKPPSALWYAADERGWWITATCDPFMAGGAYGLWVRQDRRQSPSGLDFIRATLELALAAYPVLVNITRDHTIALKTVKLGYRALGTVPFLFDGQECHVLYITQEMFEKRWAA